MTRTKKWIAALAAVCVLCGAGFTVSLLARAATPLTVIGNNFDAAYYDPDNWASLGATNKFVNDRLECHNTVEGSYFGTVGGDYDDVVLEFDMISERMADRESQKATIFGLAFGSPDVSTWAGATNDLFLINDHHGDHSMLQPVGGEKFICNRTNLLDGSASNSNPDSPLEIYGYTTRFKFIRLGTSMYLYGKHIVNGVPDGDYIKMTEWKDLRGNAGHVSFVMSLNGYFNFDNIQLTKIPAEWDTIDKVNANYTDFTSIEGEYKEKLAAPENAAILGGTFSWNAVKNAKSYVVRILDSEGNRTESAPITDTSFRIKISEPGTYTVSVYAKGNTGYGTSEESASVSYTVYPVHKEEVNNFNSSYINPLNWKLAAGEGDLIRAKDERLEFLGADGTAYFGTVHEGYRAFVAEFDYVSTLTGSEQSSLALLFGGAGNWYGAENSAVVIEETADASSVSLYEAGQKVASAGGEGYDFRGKTTKVKVIVTEKEAAVYVADMAKASPAYLLAGKFTLSDNVTASALRFAGNTATAALDNVRFTDIENVYLTVDDAVVNYPDFLPIDSEYLDTLADPVPTVKGKTVSWEPVEHAKGYLVTFNGTEYNQTETTFTIPTEFAAGTNKTVTVKALATLTYADSNAVTAVYHVPYEVLANNFNTGYINENDWLAEGNAHYLTPNGRGLVAENGELFFSGTGIAYFATARKYQDFVLEFDLINDPLADRVAQGLDYAWPHVGICITDEPGGYVSSKQCFLVIESQSCLQLFGGDKKLYTNAEETLNTPMYGSTIRYRMIVVNGTIAVYAALVTNHAAGEFVELGTYQNVGDTNGYISFETSEPSYVKYDNIAITDIECVYTSVREALRGYDEDTVSNIKDEYLGIAEAPVISIEGNRVSWGAVADARGYIVTIDGTALSMQTDTFIELTDIASGKHSITVRTVSSKQFYAQSKESNAVTYLVSGPCAAPKLTIEGNVVSWNAVEGASGYIVTVNGKAYEVQTETTFTVNADKPGSFTVTVKAVADNSGLFTDSEASEPVTYRYTEPLASPTLTIEGNVVSWNAVEGASGYIVTVNGKAYEVQTETMFAIPDTEPGNYVVTVKAVAAEGFYTDSAESASVTYQVAEPKPEPSPETPVKSGCGCGTILPGNPSGWSGLVLLAAACVTVLLLAKKKLVGGKR